MIFFKNLFVVLRQEYCELIENILIKRIPSLNYSALKRLKGKKVIKCVFFVLDESDWKYDYVFRKMIVNQRFDPIILVCPWSGFGKEYMLKKLRGAEQYFLQTLKYPVRIAYDYKSDRYLDVRKELNPDIIFYCSPYRATIHPKYYITSFLDRLSVYVPYTFNNSIDYKSFHDELLHNLVWRYYAESEEHKCYSVTNARNKGRNVVVTGYPGIEAYLDNQYVPVQMDWKISNFALKRIIWAPHHTIANTGTVIFSCFLRYYDFMVEMARKYADKVQFVLKPHPLLRPKLEKLWGKDRSDAYFRKWKNMPNTSYTEGNYVDLFLTSDAMIHDSGSFIAEYLFLNKPVMRTMNDYPIEKMYNGFTQRCIDNHYKAYSCKDIEIFILNVIEGKDPMKEKRTHFVNKELKTKGFPSDNILNDLLYSIDNQVLYRN